MDKDLWKKHKKLQDLYEKAFPNVSTNNARSEVAKKWKLVKNDPKEYSKEILTLQTKIAENQAAKINRWKQSLI